LIERKLEEVEWDDLRTAEGGNEQRAISDILTRYHAETDEYPLKALGEKYYDVMSLDLIRSQCARSNSHSMYNTSYIHLLRRNGAIMQCGKDSPDEQLI